MLVYWRVIIYILYYIIVDIHSIEVRSLPKFSHARRVRRSQRCCRGENSTSGRISEVPRFQSYVFSADPGVDFYSKEIVVSPKKYVVDASEIRDQLTS